MKSLQRRATLQRLAAGALMGCTGAASLAQAATQNIADPAATVRRIVSLGGAVTEIVYALGAEHMLVATDTTSLYPEAATRTPKVGYLRQLSAEGVLSLKPHAVIGAGEAGPPVVLEQLRAAGVDVQVVRATHDWAEVQAKLRMVAAVTGKQAQAEVLGQQLQQQWQGTQALVARARSKPRALFILAHSGSPMVAGKSTAAHALMELAGAQNVVQAFSGYRPLTAEALAAAAPHIIISTTQGIEIMGGADAFWKRPELALTPAYAKRALVAMEASQMLGFGPRLPQSLRQLHEHMQQVA